MLVVITFISHIFYTMCDLLLVYAGYLLLVIIICYFDC